MPTVHFEKLKQDRKNSIVRAFTKQFATRDYSDISVKELSAEAEISRGSFYLYFSGKDDAFLTSVKCYTDRLEQDLLDIYATSQGVEEIVLQVFDYLTHLSTFEHSFFEKISNNLSLGIPDIIAQTFDQFSYKLNDILNQRIRETGIDLTPEILDDINVRKEVLFSIMISALINISIHRTELAEERESLRKKVNFVISHTSIQSKKQNSEEIEE